MKIRNSIYLFVAMALAGCSADDDWHLSEEQQSLIGQGVNFSTSMANLFVTRATTNYHDGSFNDGDQMRIFRQYTKEGDNTGTVFDAGGEIFRTYYLKMDYAAGTSVSINSDWVPIVGKLKSDDKTSSPVVQKGDASDSLTWENGKTVRFRAWGRSNLAGHLNDSKKSTYYPDYTVSDWVTVSGPTKNIPLVMRHITCRVGLVAKAGNELSSASICTDYEDYKRTDNADTKKNDSIEASKTETQARAQLDSVMAVYNKLCMPAGVDDESFLLTAMLKARYDSTANFKDFEKYDAGIVKISELDSAAIRTTVQHPMFNANDGRLYMMSIPFDMSKESAGEELTLPACTRIKVQLRGDSGYHIFALSDIKKDNKAIFENGLTLKAGYSYTFTVGYHYNKLTITPADSFAWVDGGTTESDAADSTRNVPTCDISWFTDAYQTAVDKCVADAKVKFAPEFNIADTTQFVTFAKLVNGTAISKMSGLEKGPVMMEKKTYVTKNGIRQNWWVLKAENGDTTHITSDVAKDMGYIFYPVYHESVSSLEAYVDEECITGSIDFANTTINLTKNLYFCDVELDEGVGNNSTSPFCGHFNGNGHTIYDLNMKYGYLFENVKDAAITNLRIETIHNTCLVKSATYSESGWGCYIAGISMQCPSKDNSLAESLTGKNYVAGCIHVGKAGGALVGTLSDGSITMLGCMQASEGITSGTGALIGTNNGTLNNFMYNYFDIELSPGTTAIGGVKDKYEYNQYIRGSKSHILKAVKDYTMSDADIAKLKDNLKAEIYGYAPWKAMNLGIDKYNDKLCSNYPCNMIYSTSTDYTHRYPTLNLKP